MCALGRICVTLMSISACVLVYDIVWHTCKTVFGWDDLQPNWWSVKDPMRCFFSGPDTVTKTERIVSVAVKQHSYCEHPHMHLSDAWCLRNFLNSTYTFLFKWLISLMYNSMQLRSLKCEELLNSWQNNLTISHDLDPQVLFSKLSLKCRFFRVSKFILNLLKK